MIDESIVQRILLALFFAPLGREGIQASDCANQHAELNPEPQTTPPGLFRVLTKMSPLGLCFLKQAWKDLEATEGYECLGYGFASQRFEPEYLHFFWW